MSQEIFAELEVSPAWRQAFPNAAAGVLAVSGLVQPPAWPELDQASQQVEDQLRRRFGDRAAIKETPIAQAYTAYYKRFKKTYHVLQQVESVALKGKSIPRFSAAVQAMFTAELKNMLLTAGHDLDQVQGTVSLEVAQGDESFLGLGGRQAILKAGDMFIRDQAGIISAVIYGPDERTKITPATGRALFCVYAPPGVGGGPVEAHLQDIGSYLRLFAPQAAIDLLQVQQA